MPGRAMMPRADRQPRATAMIPPTAIPMPWPSGMAEYQIPIILARFWAGKKAEISAVPPAE